MREKVRRANVDTDMKSNDRPGKWERKKELDNMINCHRTEDIQAEPREDN